MLAACTTTITVAVPLPLSPRKPPYLTCYITADSEAGHRSALRPEAVLLVLAEQGFLTLPNYELHITQDGDARGWYNPTLLAIHAGPEPVLPVVN